MSDTANTNKWARDWERKRARWAKSISPKTWEAIYEPSKKKG